MATVADLNPAAKRYYDDVLSFVEQIHDFDAADTSGPSGSRRVVNTELATAAENDADSVELVNGVLDFLKALPPLQRAGLMVLLNRQYDNGVGQEAEAAVKEIVEARKAENANQPVVEVDYSARNALVDAANACLVALRALGGDAAAELTADLKIPNRKASSTRAPSGPRFKGNYDFNWGGRRQATKLAEVQKATGLSGLELKKIIATNNGIDPADDKAFAAFLSDPPREFSFPVSIPVKDGDPVEITVVAYRQDSDDTPELEANSEEETGDNL